jgi:putative ABC transport system substrate-binding protein
MAAQVARIFAGTAPDALPIEQPTTFVIAVNQHTARALGVTLPPAVLARADEVIE